MTARQFVFRRRTHANPFLCVTLPRLRQCLNDREGENPQVLKSVIVCCVLLCNCLVTARRFHLQPLKFDPNVVLDITGEVE